MSYIVVKYVLNKYLLNSEEFSKHLLMCHLPDYVPSGGWGYEDI